MNNTNKIITSREQVPIVYPEMEMEDLLPYLNEEITPSISISG